MKNSLEGLNNRFELAKKKELVNSKTDQQRLSNPKNRKEK